MTLSWRTGLLIGLGGTRAARGDEALFPVPAFPVGELAARVCPADFDGDGLVDLAAAAWDDHTVNILRNTGGGLLVPWQTHAFGGSPAALAAGDLDHDLDIDLVVGWSSYPDRHVEVWLNDGAGGLTAAADYAPTWDPVAFALGDFDRDLDLDVMVGEFDSNGANGGVSLWRNIGDGALTPGGMFGTTRVGALATADLDGDLDLDLLAIETSNDRVRVWLNDGSGALSSADTYGLFDPRGLAVGDFDLDSDVDFAVTEHTSYMYVYRNLGAGTFELADGFQVDAALGSIVALHLDPLESPPRLDLALASELDWLTLLQNVGGCEFQELAETRVGDRPVELAVADLDRDGDDDVVSANADGENVTIVLSHGDNTVAAPEIYWVFGVATGLAAGDLSGDGVPELVTVRSGGDARVVVLPNDGQGTFGEPLAYDGVWGGNNVVLANLDGDPQGRLDMAAASTSGDVIYVLLNQGGGSFAAPVASATGDGPYALCAADLDQDGDLDLAVTNFYGDSVSIMINNGTAGFVEAAEYPVGPGYANPRSIVALDIEADGDSDLAIAGLSGDWRILENSGGAVFQPPMAFPFNGYGMSLTSADFDRDGDADVGIVGYRDDPERAGELALWLNSGAGQFVAGGIYAAGLLPAELVTADLNADRLADLAYSDFDRGTVGVRLNLGNGTFGPQVEYFGSATGRKLVASDVDLDGRVDLCVADGEWVSVLRNQGPAGVPPPSCDVDQDGSEGDADFAAFLCCLAGPGVTQPPAACEPGLFLRADADGDGDVDLGDLSVFQAGCAWGPQGAPPLTAYWAFDEGGGSVAHDAGGAYDAQVSGATWVSGYAGTALRFTGTAEAAIPAAFDDAISAGMTVAAWLKWDGSSQLAYVLDSRGGSQSQGFIVMLDPITGHIRFYLYRLDGISTFVSTAGVPIGQWTHVAVVADFEGDAVQFFVDGLPAGGPTTYPHVYVPTTGGSAVIGNNVYSGQDRPLNGALDELRVYHRALSVAEVWEVYSTLPRP